MDNEMTETESSVSGELETATVVGSSRRRAALLPWRVRDRRPPSWWARLFRIVGNNNDDQADGVEIETRTLSGTGGG